MSTAPQCLYTCTKCQTRVQYSPCYLYGVERFTPTLCDHCEQLEAQEIEKRRESHRVKTKKLQWEEICPSQYCYIDYTLAPESLLSLLAKADKWQYSPRGIYIIGDSGTGKTLSACAILYKYHLLGYSVDILNSVSLQYHACMQFDSDRTKKHYSRSLLDRCANNTQLLLLDDLGKEASDSVTKRSSDRYECELYAILEGRWSRGFPTLWTSNLSPHDLATRFSSNRKNPIIRRLLEFSDNINTL